MSDLGGDEYERGYMQLDAIDQVKVVATNGFKQGKVSMGLERIGATPS